MGEVVEGSVSDGFVQEVIEVKQVDKVHFDEELALSSVLLQLVPGRGSEES